MGMDPGLTDWWYMFALTCHLRPAPSLADRLSRGRIVLGHVGVHHITGGHPLKRPHTQPS
jgi:hypothetical protein